MKVQLRLDLGEIRWSARNYLEGSLPCRHCQEDGQEGRTRCECAPGSVFFSILPSATGEEGDFNLEPWHWDRPERTSN